MRKRSIHIPKGMTKDLSASKFSSDYYYDALNIKLAPGDSNTLLSITNIKSNRKVNLTFLDKSNTDITNSAEWKYLGHVVLNSYIVVYAQRKVGENDFIDYIYRIDTSDNSTKLLAQGSFNFSPYYPIEGIGIYEKEEVQKAYWIDGLNQPRVINIASDSVIIDSTELDFVRTLQLDESVSIRRNETTMGFITAGTIQYVFTYYNLYGQESNIFYQSPLYYISYNNRGASPEDTSVSASFTITLDNLDTNFDYVRIYSIHRGSVDATPKCKRVVDLAIGNDTIYFVDDGTLGDDVDPTLLLYIGGREIIPYTMEQKDNTLFFGNYKEKGSIISERLKAVRGKHVSFEATKQVTINNNNPTNNFYSYKHQLVNNSSQITTYKYGETYRFGLQLQKSTGEWSEPIFINDDMNDHHPTVASVNSQTVSLVQGTITIGNITKDGTTFNWVAEAISDGYVKARPVVVFPSLVDRTVICQGILNPTVFNVGDRYTNSPFAQASWFFRPNFSTFSENSESYPTRFCHLICAEQVAPTELPSRGTEIYFVKASDDMTQSEVLDTYTYFGMIQMTGTFGKQTYTRDVLVVQGDSNFDINDQLDYAQYFIVADPNNPSTWIARLTSYNYTETPDYVHVNIQALNIPEGLQDTNGDYLAWDSDYSYYRNPYNIREIGFYVEDTAVNFSSQNYNTGASTEAIAAGTMSQFVHYEHLPFADKRNAEIQCNYNDTEVTINAGSSKSSYIDKYSDLFFIDQSIVTLNSPEIDFDISMQTIEDSSLKLRIVGCVPITATIGDMDIITSTPQLNYYNTQKITKGFWHELVGTSSAPGLYGLNTIPAWFDEIYGHKETNTFSLTSGYAVYPWHRSGSMNNQPSATLKEDDLIKGQAAGYRSAVLKRKVMSNLRFSANTVYTSTDYWDAGEVSIGLFHSNEVTNIRIKGQTTYGDKDINYYGNIDKVITSGRKYENDIIGYPIFGTDTFSASINDDYYHTVMSNWPLKLIDNSSQNLSKEYKYGYDPISMRYKSNPHAVICLKGSSGTVKILPRFNDTDETATPKDSFPTAFWDSSISISQDVFNPAALGGYGYLWLGEIYNDMHSVDANGNLVPDGTQGATSIRFGGQTDDALESNTWLPAGEAVELTGNSITLRWTEGDTYYQRYDCLKTYPFSNEDTNSIVDICSFMVETRVNIDGRYDRNRGQLSNLTMNPLNFNLINTGYTQRNNFFNYKILDHNLFNNDYYPNYVTWTKTKTPGEKTDTWTNITLANVQDLDGDKGAVQSLKRFNNSLFCFQDRGISQILYNERTQISTTDGVPIELTNSDKVQGKRYITETVGCQNKWSIATSPYGLYFIDANNKTINRLSNGIEDLTNMFGFNSWAENNIQLGVWNPLMENPGVYRGFYDGNDKEVFFVGGHGENDCLVYSESLNQFSSFYSWGKALDIFNVDDSLFAFEDSDLLGLYRQYEGSNYCRFFGKAHPMHVTYIDAQDPLDDKIYTNIEFRATVEGDGEYSENTGKFTPTLPFDLLDVWNEYQHGIAHLENRNGHSAMLHHELSNSASLKRKFRMWRCDVPRDNAPLTADEGLEITRFKTRPIDRIRNPWAYFKLMKRSDGTDKKIQLHDVIIDYFL